MKIIIVGCGKVGTTLAEELSKENHDITLIDIDGDTLQEISDSIDVMCVTGNGAVYQIQFLSMTRPRMVLFCAIE